MPNTYVQHCILPINNKRPKNKFNQRYICTLLSTKYTPQPNTDSTQRDVLGKALGNANKASDLVDHGRVTRSGARRVGATQQTGNQLFPDALVNETRGCPSLWRRTHQLFVGAALTSVVGQALALDGEQGFEETSDTVKFVAAQHKRLSTMDVHVCRTELADHRLDQDKLRDQAFGARWVFAKKKTLTYIYRTANRYRRYCVCHDKGNQNVFANKQSQVPARQTDRDMDCVCHCEGNAHTH